MSKNAFLLTLLCLFSGTWRGSAQGQGTPHQVQISTTASSDQSSSDSFVLEVASKVNATYPADAIRDKLEGEVTVRIVVSEAGEVESAEILAGNATLAQSALAAAKQWKFKTWKHKVYLHLRAWANISFDFHLTDAKPGRSASSTSESSPVEGNVVQSGELPKIPVLNPGLASRMVIHRVAPNYPAEARRARVQGSVVLLVVISTQGTIEHVDVLSGDPMLVDAAVAAVKQWRYQAYVLNGEPVEVSTEVTVNFTLLEH